MIIDSNIIIYAAQAAHGDLRTFIAEHAPAVSAVSYVEVLGYHRLAEADRQHFEAFFSAATILPIGEDVLNRAVKLRQTKKMSLGDALVAATALVHGRSLATHSTKDFDWIPGLVVIDPLSSFKDSAGSK